MKISCADHVLSWLNYLCLNSDCRGLGGYELLDCEALLHLDVVSQQGADTAWERAKVLRELIRHETPPNGGTVSGSDPNLATLHLLGLTQVSEKQPRAIRRKLAAGAYGQPLDTFQKRYEAHLLRDVAALIWGIEQSARSKRVA